MSESIQHGADGGKLWKYPTDPSFVSVTKSGKTRKIKKLSTVEMIGFILNFGLILCSFLLFSMKLSLPSLFLFSFLVSSFAVGFLVCKYAGIERSDTFRTKSVYVTSVVAGLVSVGIILAVSTVIVIGIDTRDSSSSPAQIIQEEYGYSQVDPSIANFSGEVVDGEGNVLKVGVYPYKGQNILFETPEQLSEKIAEVDAGTFEVEKP